ncbi:hypothetical protein M7I_1113 [Glarea lozoyensis 74030]|uniref:Uncharacterized protein n=1 Tax=Glarea lozoyensis (strain ATCC 74030 / MF5533) TaxID=1104152 RepID=H0EF74_GLAL7|nr:hypothetical protein M7I_1113 [Glarea lozoyensis 74030]
MQDSKPSRFSGETASSREALLPDPEHYNFDENVSRKKPRKWFKPVFVHAKSIRGENCHPNMIFSPARQAVKYELNHAENDLMKKSPYAGFPTPEGDQAWRDLLRNSNIRISADELTKLNRSSIQLQDGSGDYFGGLSAHHHLHCIKSITVWKTSAKQ